MAGKGSRVLVYRVDDWDDFVNNYIWAKPFGNFKPNAQSAQNDEDWVIAEIMGHIKSNYRKGKAIRRFKEIEEQIQAEDREAKLTKTKRVNASIQDGSNFEVVDAEEFDKRYQ